MLRKISNLKSYTLHAKDGNMGDVHDFYFDDQNWQIRYMIANTGSWLFGRHVLVSPNVLGTISSNQEFLNVNLTKDQVENSPPIDAEKPVSRQQEVELHDYYGWAPYWVHPTGMTSGVGMVTGTPVLAPNVEIANQEMAEEKRRMAKEADPTLRSIDEVTGYYIEATDGSIGHVEDFFVSEEDWTIRYLLVDTRNWLPGRKVLISPDWIKRISWDESKVFVNETKKSIEESPEYKPLNDLNRQYESELFKYYGRSGYWMMP